MSLHPIHRSHWMEEDPIRKPRQAAFGSKHLKTFPLELARVHHHFSGGRIGLFDLLGDHSWVSNGSQSTGRMTEFWLMSAVLVESQFIKNKSNRAGTRRGGLPLARKGLMAARTQKLLQQVSRPRMARALLYIGSRRSHLRDFTANGEQTNGEFTLGLLRNLQSLKPAMELEDGVNANVRISEASTAHGFLSWVLRNRLKCLGFGIEIEHKRCRVAADEALKSLKEKYAGVLFNARVGYS